MNPLAVLRVPQLAARASHEVRGPLTVALLALEGMVGRGEINADAALGLELQLRRARLGVEDLTAVVTRGRAPDRLAPVFVAGLLAQAGLAWRPVAQARGVELRIGPAPAGAAVLADQDRLSQALGNLLANALEHGAGSVEVRTRALNRRLRIEVRDGGTGLRAPIRWLSRKPRAGRGHGLAIASEIAERHGGRVVAAPSAVGATVALELPLRDAERLSSEGVGS